MVRGNRPKGKKVQASKKQVNGSKSDTDSDNDSVSSGFLPEPRSSLNTSNAPGDSRGSHNQVIDEDVGSRLRRLKLYYKTTTQVLLQVVSLALNQVILLQNLIYSRKENTPCNQVPNLSLPTPCHQTRSQDTPLHESPQLPQFKDKVLNQTNHCPL